MMVQRIEVAIQEIKCLLGDREALRSQSEEDIDGCDLLRAALASLRLAKASFATADQNDPGNKPASETHMHDLDGGEQRPLSRLARTPSS